MFKFLVVTVSRYQCWDQTVKNSATECPAQPSSDDDSGLSGGAVAGIVIGCIAVVACGAVVGFFLIQKKSSSAPVPPAQKLTEMVGTGKDAGDVKMVEAPVTKA